MNINWKRVKNWLKFHIGMKCVVRCGDKWVITQKYAFIVRECLSINTDNHKGGYYWSKNFRNNWTIFNTEQEVLDKLQWHKDKVKEFKGYKLKP